jgi:cobalt-zinc-cadmium efflux system membrane fusion protein
MNGKSILLGAACLLLAGQAAVAEEIGITDAQIRNLGIEFRRAERSPSHTAIEATASVIVPPGKEAFASAPEAGLLAGLNVSVGDRVVRGQTLAELRSPGFIALQREFLDALNANLLAQSELDRDQQLFNEGIIAGRRLHETTTRARIAATGLRECRQLLQIAGLTAAEIRTLESSQTLQPVLEIRAPFDGVVIERLAVAGERLDVMSPVYRIADLSTLWLEINVPREYLPGLRPGMKVSVVGAPLEFVAQVSAIGSAIDPGTQSVLVRATLIANDHGLAPGQFVSARIAFSEAGRDSAPIWKVPAGAVTRSGNSHFIFVRTEGGIAVRPVTVVGADSRSVFFSANVDEATAVAVTGITAIKALWSAEIESSS